MSDTCSDIKYTSETTELSNMYKLIILLVLFGVSTATFHTGEQDNNLFIPNHQIKEGKILIKLTKTPILPNCNLSDFLDTNDWFKN